MQTVTTLLFCNTATEGRHLPHVVWGQVQKVTVEMINFAFQK